MKTSELKKEVKDIIIAEGMKDLSDYVQAKSKSLQLLYSHDETYNLIMNSFSIFLSYFFSKTCADPLENAQHFHEVMRESIKNIMKNEGFLERRKPRKKAS